MPRFTPLRQVPGQRLAWCPPGNNPALAAIPLLPEVLAGQTLTGTGYRQILTDRVARMVGLLPEREQMRAVSRLQREMELRGLWGPTMVAGSDQLGQGSGPSCGQPNVAGLPQSGSGNAGVAGDTANRPGSRGDDSGKLSGGVDQAGVSSNSQPGITFLPAKYSTWVNRAFGVGCGKIGRRLAKAPRPANHALPEALLGTRLGTNKVTVQKI